MEKFNQCTIIPWPMDVQTRGFATIFIDGNLIHLTGDKQAVESVAALIEHNTENVKIV